MTKRKPLPYAAMQLRDEAIMCNSDAARELLALIKSNETTPEERMRRLGMALHHIHKSTEALKDIDGIER